MKDIFPESLGLNTVAHYTQQGTVPKRCCLSHCLLCTSLLPGVKWAGGPQLERRHSLSKPLFPVCETQANMAAWIVVACNGPPLASLSRQGLF